MNSPRPSALCGSPAAVPAEQLAQFEVTEEERQYKGESDDLKAKLEHRHVAPCPPAAAAGVATGLRRWREHMRCPGVAGQQNGQQLLQAVGVVEPNWRP